MSSTGFWIFYSVSMERAKARGIKRPGFYLMLKRLLNRQNKSSCKGEQV
jgi:hypothetical protein